jgi:hypothetical protein
MRAVRDWPFAWKLRGAMFALVLLAAVGVAGMLLYARRNQALTRELSGREMAGLALVLNVDRDAYQMLVGVLPQGDLEIHVPASGRGPVGPCLGALPICRTANT